MDTMENHQIIPANCVIKHARHEMVRLTTTALNVKGMLHIHIMRMSISV